MKSISSKLPTRLPTEFNALNAIHPLRPIADAVDLKNAAEVMNRLAVLNKRSRDQNDYLETLILLTEAYEADQIADALDPAKSSPLEALKYLLETHAMNQAALAKLLKIGASAVSMILSGDRPITADHARTLGRHFEVSPAAFL